MATYRLEDFFDARVIARIADDVSAVFPAFPRRAFLRDAAIGLERFELVDRGRHLTAALRKHVPSDPAVAPGETVALGRRVSLAQQTTRTHHPGGHAIDVRLNGRVVPAGVFTLRR